MSNKKELKGLLFEERISEHVMLVSDLSCSLVLAILYKIWGKYERVCSQRVMQWGRNFFLRLLTKSISFQSKDLCP
jgi:hypothetical protein